MKLLTNFRETEIGNLFDFPETNSKITKKFCNLHKGIIPVYASSSNEKSTLGFIEDNLKNVKYYKNCLSWNRNGSVGYVFMREHKFATNEDHRAMIIELNFQNQLDQTYLKFEIERQLLLNGFSYLDKCGVDKIKQVKILIPVNEKKEFDLIKQKSLANKYIEVKKIKSGLEIFYNDIIKSQIDFSNKYKLKLIPIMEIFNSIKGNQKYTKKYLHDHKGKYHVYSSQTTNFGQIGSIDTYDYEQECFTWTTDGVHAGTIFYRNGKFSTTTHCGILNLKEKYKDKVDFEYLYFILSKTLPINTLGEGANKRLGIERMAEIFIEIPIKENEGFDLIKQKEMAEKYKKIKEIKKQIKDDYQEIISSTIKIVENN